MTPSKQTILFLWVYLSASLTYISPGHDNVDFVVQPATGKQCWIILNFFAHMNNLVILQAVSKTAIRKKIIYESFTNKYFSKIIFKSAVNCIRIFHNFVGAVTRSNIFQSGWRCHRKSIIKLSWLFNFLFRQYFIFNRHRKILLYWQKNE